MADKTVVLETTGMHCQSCSMLIEMSVSDLDGVSGVSSDYTTGRTEVTYDADKLDVDAIVTEIEKAGYAASEAQ